MLQGLNQQSLTASSKICKCVVKLSIYSNSGGLNKDGLMHIFKLFDEVSY